MSPRWFGLVMVIGLVLPGLLQAGEDKPIPAGKLIEQLGSNDFPQRERAQQALKARGIGVLPALRKALNHHDPEVRRRLEELIPVLEAVAALEPKRVTLGENLQTLSAVLDSITKQTGYTINLDDKDDGQLHSFAMKSAPFWQALEQVCRKTDRIVSVQPFENGGIHLKRHQGESPLVFVSGSFRLEMTRFHEDRDIDFTQPGEGKEPWRRVHLLTMTVSLLAEPRFVLLGVDQARMEVAQDEEGKALTSAVPVAVKRLPDYIRVSEVLREDYQHPGDIFLRRSSAKAQRIKVLRGTFPIWVVVERKPVVVSENFLASQGIKCQVGAAPIEIKGANRDETGYCNINVGVPSKKDSIREFWRKRIHLEDAAGHRYETSGGGYTQSGDSYDVSVHYQPSNDPKVGPPTKVIIEDWIHLHHAVPFEFREVPLP